MKITDIKAYWLQYPLKQASWHRSDYGLLQHFDMCFVVVDTDAGIQGYGEAKAAVGSAGVCASLVTTIEQELKPQLLGKDPRNINHIWEEVYNGSRAHYAHARGRAFPILGRRGLTISALSGIDMALWDILGKSLKVPVLQLLGGAVREKMPVYASGGWADTDTIGEQLVSYTDHGFKAVKMRVGVMDDTVAHSVDRVKAAREALGPDIKLMADAHGTFSVPEAKQFCKAVEDCNLFWFEEPINPDNRVGTAEVRAYSHIPIACGESEYTRFDIKDLIEEKAVDVLQPDAAIIGGISEAVQVAHLARTYQLALAPHCWGSILSFMAGLHVAFASSAAHIIEYSLGGAPFMHELGIGRVQIEEGWIDVPQKPGLGVDIHWPFVEQYTKSK